MRHLINIGLLCCTLGVLEGQTYNQYLREANTSYYDHQDYHNALRFYTKALRFCPADSVSLMYKIAESARRSGRLSVAEDNYKKVIKYNSNNEFPDASLRLGQVYQMNGNYSEALEYCRLYKSENDGDDIYNEARYKHLVDACTYALKGQNDPCILRDITMTRIGDNINSGHHEFAPVIEPGENSISFSSMRYLPEDCCHQDFPYMIGKVLKSEQGSEAVIYDDKLTKGGSSVTHLVYNSDRTRVYYTICDNTNTLKQRCDIYKRSLTGGTLGDDEEKLPFPINQDSFTTTHPNIGLVKGKEVLFFASDRIGTKGGLDIWYWPIGQEHLSTQPTNLSGVNTAYDDATPFFHNDSHELFFSSKGYGDSYGGYDMRRAIIDQSKSGYASDNLAFYPSVNLGSDWNSSSDDFYYTESMDHRTAWFSSNRLDTSGSGDLCACCYDIFKVNIEPEDPVLAAISVYGCDALLEEAATSVVNLTTGAELIAVSRGRYNVERCGSYKVTATAPGFAQGSIEIVVPETASGTVTHSISLATERVRLVVNTWQGGCDTKSYDIPATGLSVRAKDLTDRNLPDLLRLGENRHQVIFDNLISGHRYEVITEIYDCSFSDIIVADPDAENCEIPLNYCCKDEPCVPCFSDFRLYFDNDYPDPNTTRTTATSDYTSTYNAYMSANKREEYVDGYATCSYKDEDASRTDIDAWFDIVEQDYTGLKEVFECLPEWLIANEGKKVTFELFGHASSRHESDYNQILSARRVDAVDQMMNRWLRYYGLPAHRVVIKPETLGDSDCTFEGKGSCSIYDPAASACRNVLVKINCEDVAKPPCDPCTWGEVVNLYFDQNEPRSGSRSSLTYAQYRKQYDTPRRRREYITGLTLTRQELCRDTTCSASTTAGWFSLVEMELNKLDELMECIPSRLEYGQRIKITLQGFDNTVNPENHNTRLINRRIRTVRNMFRQLSSKYGDRIVFENIVMGPEECQPAYRTFYKSEYDDCDRKSRTNSLIYHPDEANCRKVRVLVECIND